MTLILDKEFSDRLINLANKIEKDSFDYVMEAKEFYVVYKKKNKNSNPKTFRILKSDIT